MSDAKPRILIQLDGDPQASTFDAIVAIDAGADHLLRHHGVRPEQVRCLVYGAMFTRGVDQLHRTAVFVGGSDVTAGEALLAEVRRSFFGPMRVSVMMDSNGANTTAAAAVLAAESHVDLRGSTALALQATGAVGRRVVHLLARQGADVRVASPNLDWAQTACAAVKAKIPDAQVSPWVAATTDETAAAAEGCQILIAAGAPGTQLMPAGVRRQCRDLAVAIDLNAVPPLGLEGIDPMDRAVDRDGVKCYGALGVGAVKMKIHKAAIRRLFESNDQVLDVEEMLAIGRAL
jgi:methylenetetrahydrofolate/methylenetetrahydromethanopterin dehydrogenase (NADP+)